MMASESHTSESSIDSDLQNDATGPSILAYVSSNRGRVNLVDMGCHFSHSGNGTLNGSELLALINRSCLLIPVDEATAVHESYLHRLTQESSQSPSQLVGIIDAHCVMGPWTHAMLADYLELPLDFTNERIIRPFLLANAAHKRVVYRNGLFFSHRYFQYLQAQVLGMCLASHDAPLLISTIKELIVGCKSQRYNTHDGTVEEQDIVQAINAAVIPVIRGELSSATLQTVVGSNRVYLPAEYLLACWRTAHGKLDQYGLITHKELKKMHIARPFEYLQRWFIEQRVTELPILHDTGAVVLTDVIVSRLNDALQPLLTSRCLTTGTESNYWVYLPTQIPPILDLTSSECHGLLVWAIDHLGYSGNVHIICESVAVSASYIAYIKAAIAKEVGIHAESLALDIQFEMQRVMSAASQKKLGNKQTVDNDEVALLSPREANEGIRKLIIDKVIKTCTGSTDRVMVLLRRLSPELFDEITVFESGGRLELLRLRTQLLESFSALDFIKDLYRQEIDAQLKLQEEVANWESLHIDAQRDKAFERHWGELVVNAKAIAILDGNRKLDDILSHPNPIVVNSTMLDAHWHVLRTRGMDIVALLLEYFCIQYNITLPRISASKTVAPIFATAPQKGGRKHSHGPTLSSSSEDLRVRSSLMTTEFMKDIVKVLPREIGNVLMKLWVMAKVIKPEVINLWVFLVYFDSTVANTLGVVAARSEKKRDKVLASEFSKYSKDKLRAITQALLVDVTWTRIQANVIALCLLFNDIHSSSYLDFMTIIDLPESCLHAFEDILLQHLTSRKLHLEWLTDSSLSTASLVIIEALKLVK